MVQLDLRAGVSDVLLLNDGQRAIALCLLHQGEGGRSGRMREVRQKRLLRQRIRKCVVVDLLVVHASTGADHTPSAVAARSGDPVGRKVPVEAQCLG